MPGRRQLLFMAGAVLGLTPALACLRSPDAGANQMTSDTQFRVQKSDEEWRDTLSAEQYAVLRGHGTERAFTSPLNNEKRPGTFVCAGCKQLLFSSDTKYDSGTGWPSFYGSLEGAVGTTIDRSLFAQRTAHLHRSEKHGRRRQDLAAVRGRPHAVDHHIQGDAARRRR